MKTHFDQETKGWGTVRHVFSEPHCAVSVLDVVKGGYSSKHFHRERVNGFFVHSGVIEVVQYTPDGLQELSRDRLEAGDWLHVGDNIVHRFEVLEPGIVVEIYYPSAEVRLNDIVRLDRGGVM